MDMIDETQEFIDRFYWQRGPCCAGCDWWGHINSLVGECHKSAPVSAAERVAMLGISNCSMSFGAGHVMTRREHHCGDFKDEFDWPSLPLAYLTSIGVPRQRRFRRP
jgi:hypothetical protein